MLRFKAKQLLAALTALLLTLAGAGAGERQYTLGVGDVLRIKVYEWPDLTGEFSVSPPGTVFLTIIGEVPAEGLTPAQLAREIAKRLKEVTNLQEPPSTTVEITEFRPFFIAGDVQNPGEYSYRPGLTVLQAISIAGGYYRRAEDGLLRLERDSISARGRLRVLAAQLERALARRARLDAELDDQADINFPTALLERADEPAVAALLREERLLLVAQREAFRDKDQSLVRARGYLEAQIESVGKEIELIGQQQRTVEQELESVQALVERGLARAPRQLELERLQATFAAQRTALETAILRARHTISQVDQARLDLHSEKRERMLVDSQETHAKIKETLEELETTRGLIDEAEILAPQLARERFGDARIEPSYFLLRRAGGEERRMAAGESTEVEPGDIILVERSRRPAGSLVMERAVPAGAVLSQESRSE